MLLNFVVDDAMKIEETVDVTTTVVKKETILIRIELHSVEIEFFHKTHQG